MPIGHSLHTYSDSVCNLRTQFAQFGHSLHSSDTVMARAPVFVSLVGSTCYKILSSILCQNIPFLARIFYFSQENSIFCKKKSFYARVGIPFCATIFNSLQEDSIFCQNTPILYKNIPFYARIFRFLQDYSIPLHSVREQ